MLTIAKYFSLTRAKLIHYMSSHRVFKDLFIFSHLHFHLPNGLFVVFTFPIQNPLCSFTYPHATTDSPTVSTLVLSPEYNLLRGTNRKFHRTIFFSFPFLPLFFHFLSTLFSDTFSLCSSHCVRDEASFFPPPFVKQAIQSQHFIFFLYSHS